MVKPASAVLTRGLLVPLDGSPLAEQALPLAASLAQRARTSVRLIGVLPPLPAAIINAELAVAAQRLDVEAAARLRLYLGRTADRLAASHDIPVAWVIERGTPAEVIAHYAAEQQVGLVVMTTHGRGGLSRLWLGSVADALIRMLDVPVLLFRPRHEPWIPELSRLLVPLDGSRRAEAALEPALAIGALTPGASLTLVQVLEPPQAPESPAAATPVIPMDWPAVQRAGAERYLAEVATRPGMRGLQVSTSVLVGYGIAHQITDLAREVDAGLIALSTRGAGTLERLLLGSVADKLVRSAEQAVLVVPAKAVPVIQSTPRRQPRRARKVRQA